jgi:hypothetical protein
LTIESIKQNALAAIAQDEAVKRAVKFDPLGLAPKDAGGKPTKPRAGGGAARESESVRGDRMAKEVMDAWRTEDIAGVEHTIQVFAQQEARKEAEAQASAIADATWAELEMLWGAEEKAAARRKPIDDIAELTQALGGLADIAPEVGAAFAEIGAVFAKTGEAGGTMGDAVVASIGPMGKLAAGFIKNEKDKALIRGLVEVAESIASFASGNIPGGVGHAASAAAFFAAAGKGGAGGARGIGSQGGSGPRGSDAAANDNGAAAPATVVYNISAGVMDGQSVQRSIVRAEGSARGTGWESRRGW